MDKTYNSNEVKKRKKYDDPISRKQSTGEMIANSISHFVGAGLAIAALVLLVFAASKYDGWKYMVSALLFGISMVILYTNSTLLHCFPEKGKLFKIFQRMDHSSIYLLIAGTYTPYCIITLDNKIGYVIFLIEWTLAIIGVVLKCLLPHKFQRIHLVIFLLLGWIVVAVFPSIYGTLDTFGLLFLIIGGISYSVGVAFYISKFKYQHFVWHIFVLLGTGFHFFSIYFSVF